MSLVCTATFAHATQFPPGPTGNCGGVNSDTLKIFDVQNPASLCHPAPGDTVFGLRGICIGFDKVLPFYDIYIQNSASGANGSPWTGVDVYTATNNFAGNLGLVLGDSIAVEWSMTYEFNGGTQMQSPNLSTNTPNIIIRKISSGNPLPAFHLGTTAELQQLATNYNNAEPWEDCLVRISGLLRVARTSATGGMVLANAFILVDANVCAGGSCDSVFVDGSKLTSFTPPTVGTLVHQVQGIFTQAHVQSNAGLGSDYHIMLRGGNDIDLGIAGTTEELPVEISLEVFPNPARYPTLSFALPKASHVEIGVYDLVGRKVATVVNEEFAAGAHSHRWDGRDASGHVARAGVYFLKLRAGTKTRLMRMVKLD